MTRNQGGAFVTGGKTAPIVDVLAIAKSTRKRTFSSSSSLGQLSVRRL